MDLGIIVTFTGIVVAALAGVLGVWMERDRQAPPRWAWVFSALIIVAMFIELGHSMVQAQEDAKTDEAMVRVLEQLTELAAKGNNPALEQFVGAELALQARANPGLVDKLEERIEENGGDPSAVRSRAAEGRRTAAGLTPTAGPRAGTSSRGRTTRGSSVGTGRRGGSDGNAAGVGAGRRGGSDESTGSSARRAGSNDADGEAATGRRSEEATGDDSSSQRRSSSGSSSGDATGSGRTGRSGGGRGGR